MGSPRCRSSRATPTPATPRSSTRCSISSRACAPLVLVLDDLHWIDTPSLRVLQRVVGADLPGVTVLAAYRYTDVRQRDPLAAALADLRRLDHVRRLTIHGLDQRAVEVLVAAVGGAVSDAERHALAQVIHTRTAGNALFVRELILHVANRDDAATDLPDGLVELIDRRVSRLGDDTVGVLRVAAAVGQRFSVDVVEDAVHLDRARRGAAPGPSGDVISDLELARDAAVVVDDEDGMEFRHAVVRAALLGQMSAARRQRLHRDIATVLERAASSAPADHLAALAHHHDLARSPEAPEWHRRAARAATDAFDVGAVQLAERGLELLAGTDADPALRCDLLIARAMGLRLAGHETLADARMAAEAAIALGDETRIASALQTLSVRLIDRDASDHIAFLADGLRHLHDASQTSRWSVAVGLSLRKVMLPSANAVEHRADLAEIVAHLDPDDPSACRLAMRCARSLTAINHPRDAVAITERFGPGCQGVDSDGLPIELGLSTMWLHLGERAASDRYLDLAARDPLRRSGLFDCQVRQRLAMRHLLDGRWDDAAAEIDEARARGAHDPNIRLGCDAQANWLRRERGDVEACYVATVDAGRAAAGARAGAGRAGVGCRRGRPPRRRPSPARPAGRRRLRRRPGGSGWPCWRSGTWRGRPSRSRRASTRLRYGGCSAPTPGSWPSPAPASSPWRRSTACSPGSPTSKVTTIRADALFAGRTGPGRRRGIGAARRPHAALVGPRPPAPWRSGRCHPAAGRVTGDGRRAGDVGTAGASSTPSLGAP